MPTYAYACKDCTHTFDIHQSFSEDSLTVCPQCEGSLRKKFNSVGVVFKGSGFYRTDSRDAKASTGSGKDSGSSSDSGGTSSSTSGDTGSSNGSTGSPEKSGASSNGTGSSGTSTPAPAAAGAGSGKAAS